VSKFRAEEIPVERGHQRGVPPKKSLFYRY